MICVTTAVSVVLRLISAFQGFLQQLRQIAGRMSSGPRGAGLGVKLLIGAGALAYGVKEATYTGNLLHADVHSVHTPVARLLDFYC